MNPIRFNTRTSFFKRLINLSVSGNIDPYSYKLDSISELSNGTKMVYQKRINEMAFKNNQGIGSLAFINIALGFRFSAKDFKGDTNEEEKESTFGTRQEIDYINSNIVEYIDFNVPWSLNASYNLNRRKIGFRDPTITQTLTLSGDLSLSEKPNYLLGQDMILKIKCLLRQVLMQQEIFTAGG